MKFVKKRKKKTNTNMQKLKEEINKYFDRVDEEMNGKDKQIEELKRKLNSYSKEKKN